MMRCHGCVVVFFERGWRLEIAVLLDAFFLRNIYTPEISHGYQYMMIWNFQGGRGVGF